MNRFFLFSPLFIAGQAFAQDDRSVPPDGGMWQTFTMIAIAIVFFYFIMWRPEQKRRKLLEDQRASLQQGQKVVAMGIIGTIQRVEEETVILKMHDGSKIEVLKGAITQIMEEGKPAGE